MYIIICIFKIQACSLVTDVDCSELHVAMETMQAYLKVANLANKGNLSATQCEICQSLHPYLS